LDINISNVPLEDTITTIYKKRWDIWKNILVY
jgi:hypothetical protein